MGKWISMCSSWGVCVRACACALAWEFLCKEWLQYVKTKWKVHPPPIQSHTRPAFSLHLPRLSSGGSQQLLLLQCSMPNKRIMAHWLWFSFYYSFLALCRRHPHLCCERGLEPTSLVWPTSATRCWFQFIAQVGSTNKMQTLNVKRIHRLSFISIIIWKLCWSDFPGYQHHLHKRSAQPGLLGECICKCCWGIISLRC